MSSVVVICTIFYGGYFLFDMTQYQETIQTTSETKCHNIAKEYHRGMANAYSYDMDDRVGKMRYEQICGKDGVDCKKR